MNPRVTRARSLGQELLECLEQLADEVRGPNTVVFLDRLSRCETFEPAELEEAGVADIVAQARGVRREATRMLGAAAASVLDLGGLVDRGYRLASGEIIDGDDATSFAMTALVVGAVTPALPDSERARAEEACHEVAALMQANPGWFSEAAAVGVDRALYERPSRMPKLARELIAVLRATPELEAADEAHQAQPASREARAYLEGVLRPLRRIPTATPTDTRSLLQCIRDVLWPESEPSLGFALAASGPSEQTFAPLRSALGGDFMIVRRGSRVSIEWQRSEAESKTPPELWREIDGTWCRLAQNTVEGGGEWVLSEPLQGARLEARRGADTADLDLP